MPVLIVCHLGLKDVIQDPVLDGGTGAGLGCIWGSQWARLIGKQLQEHMDVTMETNPSKWSEFLWQGIVEEFWKKTNREFGVTGQAETQFKDPVRGHKHSRAPSDKGCPCPSSSNINKKKMFLWKMGRESSFKTENLKVTVSAAEQSS